MSIILRSQGEGRNVIANTYGDCSWLCRIDSKGRLVLNKWFGSYETTNWNETFVYQAWPPRAWRATKGGRWTSMKFGLNVSLLLGLARTDQSKKMKEFRENAAIWRAGFRPNSLAERQAQKGTFFESVPCTEMGNAEEEFRRAARALPGKVTLGEVSPVTQWTRLIPKEVRKAVERTQQSHVLFVLCYAVPEFLQLLTTYPWAAGQIATLVSKPCISGYMPIWQKSARGTVVLVGRRTVKDLCRLPHKELTRLLLSRRSAEVLPNHSVKKSLVKQMRGLPKSQMLNSGWRLEELIQEGRAKGLEHIDIEMFSIHIGEFQRIEGVAPIRALTSIASPSLLRSILQLGRRVTRAGNKVRKWDLGKERLVDIANLRSALLRQKDLAAKVEVPKGLLTRKAQTNEELDQLHDELSNLLSAYKELEADSIQFPEPPVPGNKEIIPITNAGDLHREGRKMHHCVSSYQDWVLKGESFIYHVQMGDEEATLELGKDDGFNSSSKEWLVNQLRGVCNEEVSKEMRQMVDKWLRVATHRQAFKGGWR